MELQYKFSKPSEVKSSPSGSAVSFSPDCLRQPTYFVGEISHQLSFREAISALHQVVLSDFRFKPKDREEYRRWLAEQEGMWLAEAMYNTEQLQEKIDAVKGRLVELNKQADTVMGPYYKAQREYFNYLYKKDYTSWLVLDPVITVHPDQLFFECFSKDESSYAKLSCKYDVFNNIKEFECGTTNIDYSVALYNEFQKLREYKNTQFTIDPSGFKVDTEKEDSFKEEKIDIPESWVRGFMQVSSAMTFDSIAVELHPTDMVNLLFTLKRNKEVFGPRFIEYILEEDKPIKIRIAPWDIVIDCPRSIYAGKGSHSIKVWGRRRLGLLERILPLCKSFRVYLLGTGMPSFYVADLGDMEFTLGLSGWTANDWSQRANFGQLIKTKQANGIDQQKIFTSIARDWFKSPDDICRETGIDKDIVNSALVDFAQAGKGIYDVGKGVFRRRELFRETEAISQLSYIDEKEKLALDIIRKYPKTKISINKQKDTTVYNSEIDSCSVKVAMNDDLQIKSADCTCNFHKKNKLYKGPCQHIIAVKHLAVHKSK